MASYGNYDRSGSHYIEEENDQLTTQLRSKVKTLKSLTINIGEEVRSQNQLLNDMDDDFSRSGSVLQKTLRRLGVMSRSLHNYHTPLLLAFVVFVFVVLWLALKFR